MKKLEKLLEQKPEPTSQKEVEADELLGVKAVSELLGLAINTIHKKAYRKELPHMKRGKFLYFKRSEIMEYLNRGKVLSNDEIQLLANKKLNSKK
jgi:predicted DNA-binding transcriptional regulator AlpA